MAERKTYMSADEVLAIRDSLLASLNERMQNYDYWITLSTEQRWALTGYRQDLLDIEKQEGFPNILWPQPPF